MGITVFFITGRLSFLGAHSPYGVLTFCEELMQLHLPIVAHMFCHFIVNRHCHAVCDYDTMNKNINRIVTTLISGPPGIYSCVHTLLHMVICVELLFPYKFGRRHVGWMKSCVVY